MRKKTEKLAQICENMRLNINTKCYGCRQRRGRDTYLRREIKRKKIATWKV